MNPKELSTKVVDKMYNNDLFSRWLGIERIEENAGKSVLKMTIRKEMLNGFDIAHGGVTFSLADSALAFASNSHGRKSVVIEAGMSYPAPVKEGDVITAVAEEVSLTNKIGTYNITITNQDNIKVGLFKGTVYRKSEKWFPEIK